MEDPQSIITDRQSDTARYVLVVVLIGLWALWRDYQTAYDSRISEAPVYWSQLPFTEEWRSVIVRSIRDI